MSTEDFYVVLSIFLVGLLALLYGRDVNNENVSVMMGLVTLVAIPVLPIVVLVYMFL